MHVQQKMGVRMNVLVVLAYSILIHPLIEIVQSVEENCYRGDEYEYDNPCANQPGQPMRLDYCPAGQRLAERCTERCVFCEDGSSFSDSFNNCLQCKPCRTECPRGQVIIQRCTIESDAVCGCPTQSCPTSPPSTCEPCPTVTPCPTIPTETDKPETSSQPQVPLQFTQNCPSDIEEWTEDDGSNISVSWVEPQVTPGSRIVYQNYKPGHNFPVDRFEVVYVFANNSGATLSCSFAITVKAPVKPTDGPFCDPLMECRNSTVSGFLLGVLCGAVVTLLVLLLLWLLCYWKKCPCLKKLCPNHQDKAEEEDLKDECVNLLGRCPNPGNDIHQRDNNHIPQVQAQGNHGNHRQAAGNQAQADGGCKDDKDPGGGDQHDNNHIPHVQGNHEYHQQAAGSLAQAHGGCRDDKDTDTEMDRLKEDDKETESEENPQNGLSGPTNVGQATGGQQGNDYVEHITQQSPSSTKRSSQHGLTVDLPPENSSSVCTENPSHSETSSQEEGQPTDSTTNTSPQSPPAAGATSSTQYENLPAVLKNPDVEVKEVDIDWIAGRVADNDRYYERKDTFIRSVIGYGAQKRIEEDLPKTDRRTRIFKFLYEGWLTVESSRKQSDLAAKLRKFDKSLEQEFIKYINE